MASKEAIEAVDELAKTWADLRMDDVLARLDTILDDARIVSAPAGSMDPGVQHGRMALGAKGNGFLVIGRVPLAGVILQAFHASPAKACAMVELACRRLVESVRAEAVKS